MAWLVGGWEEKLFFSQMLCRFLLITICGSFTKTTFIGMEVVVFRGVSRKQRENGEKQDGGGGEALPVHSYISLVFSHKTNFKHFDLTDNSILLFPL